MSEFSNLKIGDEVGVMSFWRDLSIGRVTKLTKTTVSVTVETSAEPITETYLLSTGTLRGESARQRHRNYIIPADRAKRTMAVEKAKADFGKAKDRAARVLNDFHVSMSGADFSEASAKIIALLEEVEASRKAYEAVDKSI